ncbi:MAG: cupin domain-containing protein [Chloroflexaceae bacterium]|nr:cupin domain-containing protein [Chloroflexaceae bacterium]NJL32698.1 cupin domain-containing protein [Chloroflexaceae bacterium]NJO05087.1 cupin domain-containing protein [Chloroflexaceae bacterium]
MQFFRPEDMPIREMVPGIRMQNIGHGEHLHLVRVFADPGAELPRHQHPHEQLGVVLLGSVLIGISDMEPRRVVAGESYRIPGGVTHSAKFHEAAVVIECFSPVREEYLT